MNTVLSNWVNKSDSDVIAERFLDKNNEKI